MKSFIMITRYLRSRQIVHIPSLLHKLDILRLPFWEENKLPTFPLQDCLQQLQVFRYEVRHCCIVQLFVNDNLRDF